MPEVYHTHCRTQIPSLEFFLVLQISLKSSVLYRGGSVATDHLRQPAGCSLGGGRGAPTQTAAQTDCVSMNSLLTT